MKNPVNHSRRRLNTIAGKLHTEQAILAEAMQRMLDLETTVYLEIIDGPNAPKTVKEAEARARQVLTNSDDERERLYADAISTKAHAEGELALLKAGQAYHEGLIRDYYEARKDARVAQLAAMAASGAKFDI